MECLLRLAQLPEAGPLTWVRTPGCCQLAGWYLPTGIDNGSGDGGT
jgi:hypothetical protein